MAFSHCVLGVLFLSTTCLALRQDSASSELTSQGGLEGMAELCDPSIVAAACRALDLTNNPTTINAFEIGYMLSATRESSVKALKAMGLDAGGGHAQYVMATDTESWSCQELCSHVVKAIPTDLLPPTYDTGCYRGPDGRICDIDLSPSALSKIKFPESHPDFHSGHPIPHNPAPDAEPEEANPLSITGHAVQRDGLSEVPVELAMTKIANLFRIYPMTSISEDYDDQTDQSNEDDDEESRQSFLEELGSSSSLEAISSQGCNRVMCHPLPEKCRLTTLCGQCKACRAAAIDKPSGPAIVKPNRPTTTTTRPPVITRPPIAKPPVGGGGNPKWSKWRRDVEKISIKAQAYVARALVLNRQESRELQRWFGSTSDQARREALRVLNSISSMLSNVAYTKGSPICSPNTYAFVYPQGPKSKNSKGQFRFFLCDYYFKSSEGEQIETLTHEGSHHATAFTDDVCAGPTTMGKCSTHTAYGRSVCLKVAQQSPAKALKNADNHCYYINDLNGHN